MLTDEQGRAKCVACGLCPQICPANCIKLVPGEDEQGNRYPLVYEIDEFRCVFCGYCQEVCPEEAIHVGVHYENAEYERDRFVYDLERLCAQTHPVSTLWDPSDPEGRVGACRSLTLVFWAFAVFAVVAAGAVHHAAQPGGQRAVARPDAVRLAALYVLLDAQFIGVLQVLVYAGAIMVLFLFVIMLLNLGRAASRRPARAGRRGRGGRARGGAADPAARPAAVCAAGRDPAAGGLASRRCSASRASSARSRAPLFDTYLVPFEITSLLLLAAIVGAVVLAKRKL